MFQYQKLYQIKSIPNFNNMNQNSANKTQQFTRKKIEQFSYGLNDIIGKGYSSQVYKGRHDHSQQSVAVKVIDMKMLKNEINRHLLESQIQILKEIKNVEKVLKFHEVYTTKNNTYIITQLCSSDLNIKIKNKITQDEAFQFMDQIVQGYLQIYQKQIVHRDLKPANILLTDKDQCKIADFGFAIKNQELSKPSKYNVGSPLYMAPQSLRKNQYSYKTDLWSIGVIFFELLTGQTPWKSKTEKDLLRKMQVQRIQSVIHRRKLNFTPKVIDFLSKILCIDKHKRLQPQQLRRYTFRNVLPDNILMQAKLNIQSTKQTVNKNLMNKSITSPSNKMFQRQILTALKTPQKNIENMSFNTTLKFTNTVRNQSENRIELNKDELKLVSKQLISQIHFCRFLFKLIHKIKQCWEQGILKNDINEGNMVIYKFTSIIRHKIVNLSQFGDTNFLGIQQKLYKQYKSSIDYKKILKISRQYNQRYENELNQNWNRQFTNKFTTQQILQLINKMLQLFQENKNYIYNEINKFQKDIITFDYLITAKQLLQILNDGENYQKFTRKSKIQQILQGTTSAITINLYQQIIQRAKLIIKS